MSENLTNGSYTNQEIVNLDVNSTLHYRIGVVLSICGNIIIAVALNCQKLAHRKVSQYEESLQNTDTNETSPNERKPLVQHKNYLKFTVWWVGIFLMAVGELGNFVAYGFAPASVVAPLGSFAVIANGFVAMIMNEEYLRMRDIIGTSFALVGCFFIIQFSDQNEEILDSVKFVEHLKAWPFILYILVEITTLITLLILKHKQSNESHVILHLSLVAIIGSFTVISAKAVSGMLTTTFMGNNQFNEPIFYVMAVILAVTIVYQVKYLNEAIASYDIAVVVPINFVFFTTSAIIAGAVLFDEFFTQSGISIIMFVFGCLLSTIGVVFISGGKNSTEIDEGSLHVEMLPRCITCCLPNRQENEIENFTNPQNIGTHEEETSND